MTETNDCATPGSDMVKQERSESGRKSVWVDEDLVLSGIALCASYRSGT